MDVRQSFLYSCLCFVKDGLYFSVFGISALRVQFTQAPLPLSTCPAPKEVIAEVSQAHTVAEDPCATCVGIHLPLLLSSSPRTHSFLCCIHPRSSVSLCCGGGCGWESKLCGCKDWGCWTANWDLGGLFGRLLLGPVSPRANARLWCGVGRARIHC